MAVDQARKQCDAGQALNRLVSCQLANRYDGLDAIVFNQQRVALEWRRPGAVDEPLGGERSLHTLSRGSSASRRPSPSRLSARTASMIARPGKVAIHHCSRKY